MVELQSAIEHRFAMEIPDEVWHRTLTVADLRRIVMPAEVMAGAAEARSTAPAPQAAVRADDIIYPRWPWSAPVRWLRAAFLECVSVPLTLLLLGPRIQRDRNLGDAGPMLIVANHVTAFDVPIVLAALPSDLRRRTAVAMAGGLLTGWRHARAERHGWVRFATPVAYWLVTALFNVFPLPQGAGFRRSFAHAGAALDRGMSVLLFPEGRRSPDGTLGAFQSGIGLLARESGVPVLLVVTTGLGEIKLRRRRRFRPGNVTVLVADALTMQAEETPQAFTARLEATFRELTARAALPLPSRSTSR
jgi:long-chain acyl-CoA synthetase